MSKVVFKELHGTTAREIAGKGVSVTEKKVKGRPGKLYVLQAESSSFGRDLTYVFGKNVAKARRENKRVTGSADGAPAKR